MEAFFYDKLLVTYLTRYIAKYLFLLTYLRAHNRGGWIFGIN